MTKLFLDGKKRAGRGAKGVGCHIRLRVTRPAIRKSPRDESLSGRLILRKMEIRENRFQTTGTINTKSTALRDSSHGSRTPEKEEEILDPED
jgi:hypothetical protein